MKVLLDSNIILFAMYAPENLTPEALEWLKDSQHDFVYSILSIWEIEIKHNKNPKAMPVTGQMVETLCRQCGMERAELRSEHIYELHRLTLPEDAPPHKDPFDKLLLCQAEVEKCVFLTHDSKLVNYGLKCVKYV